MNTEKLTWYVARSGGIVAWLLLALGLVLGLLLSSRVLGRRASPAWVLSIHRFLGGLSVIFTAVHVAAVMLDDFVSFGWSDVLVPWSSEWNPGAVAWGIIAMYLAVAIELTSFAMRRLPKGLWRGVHWLSGPLFVMATVHGYQAGSDAGRAFIIAIVGFCLVLAGLTVVRVVQARRATEPKTSPSVLLDQAKARRAAPTPATADAPTAAWTDLGMAEPRPLAAEPDEEPFWMPAEPAVPSTLPRTPLAPQVNEPVRDRQDERLLQPVGGPADAPPPRPAWTEPNDLEWLTSEADHDPGVHRRPGPAPGVWKRTRRDRPEPTNN